MSLSTILPKIQEEEETRQTRKIACNLPGMQIKGNKWSPITIARARRRVALPLHFLSALASCCTRSPAPARNRRYSCTTGSLKLGPCSLNETAIVRDRWEIIGFSESTSSECRFRTPFRTANVTGGNEN